MPRVGAELWDAGKQHLRSRGVRERRAVGVRLHNQRTSILLDAGVSTSRAGTDW